MAKIAEAIVIFEFNTKSFPSSANAWDSLGEAYLVMGAPDKAVEYYERALTISPTFGASRTGRAWAWGMLGRFDQAIEDDPPDPLVKALLRHGANPDVLLEKLELITYNRQKSAATQQNHYCCSPNRLNL